MEDNRNPFEGWKPLVWYFAAGCAALPFLAIWAGRVIANYLY